MRLVVADERKTCIAAALAMVLELPYDQVLAELYSKLTYPFPEPWQQMPKVPDMNVVVDWAYSKHHAALVPFERNPVCTPHLDCKPVPVWYNGDSKFRDQLRRGIGLIECVRRNGLGHMVAWDGKDVFDPEGYRYPYERLSDYGLEAKRFWLCT